MVICKTNRTRSGFNHVATLYVDGQSEGTAKCVYYNRTWESYQYESVLQKLFTTTKRLTDTEKKEAMQYVETYKEDGGMLRMCSMVAAMGEVMQPDNSSAWKKRFLSMCPGIEFPADFDQLSEEEKQRRLDGAINAGLDENK